MKVVWDFGGRRGSSTCLGVCVSVCVSGFWEEAEPLPPLPHSLWLRPVGRNRAWLHRRHQTPWETVYLWVTVNKPDTTRCDCNICKQWMIHSCIIHQSVINKTSETQRELVYRHTVNRPDSEAAGWPSLDAGAAAAERSASSELSNGNMEEKSRSGETVYWTQNFLIRFQQAGTTWNRPRSAAHLILI